MIFNDTILPFERTQKRKKTRRVINDFLSQCHTAFTAEEKSADRSLKRRQMAEAYTGKGVESSMFMYFIFSVTKSQ